MAKGKFPFEKSAKDKKSDKSSKLKEGSKAEEAKDRMMMGFKRGGAVKKGKR